MTYVDASGVRTHVATWGAGRDVLLIHGASSDVGVWKPTVAPLLQDRFRLVAYDRPGLGLTQQRPAGAETLAVQASIAAGVISAMDLKRPLVIAHSYGGAVALRLALDHPDRVGGLVLIAPVAYRWPGGVSWHLHWSGKPLIGDLFNNLLSRPFVRAAAREGLKKTFAPSPMPPDYFEIAGVARALRPAAMRANALDVLALNREVTAQQARYPSLALPVAILAGDADTVVGTAIHSLPLAQAAPLARIEVVRGAGHLPHESVPGGLLKLVDWAAGASMSGSSGSGALVSSGSVAI